MVCATINDLDQFVMVPKFIVDGVVKASGLTPRWPAGVFVIFTDEGATVCVYGANENQEFEFRRNTITLSEDANQNSPVGDAVWLMWKDLRGVPEETLSVNLYQLMTTT